MSSTPTPHISCAPGDFARTVLMPGDPLRARYIAEHFLQNPVLVNNVRGVQGYTGEYKGKKVSVMASGMGTSSIGIYSYELFNFYGVENIIRIGSAGMIQPELKLRSLVAAMSAYSNSAFGAQFGFNGNLAPCASWKLLKAATEKATEMGIDLAVGAVYSSDCFYDASAPLGKLRDLGVMCVEMEAYALYLNAAYAKKNALAILTISDDPFTGKGLDAEARQNTFTQMMEIALEIA